MSTKVLNTVESPYDVLIVGGGPAGLTAALYLGRGRRSAIVLDRGEPRHAVSAGVHNFLTRDGTPPAELRRIAWEQMAAYPTVEHRVTIVERLERVGDDGPWRADTDTGEVFAREVLLATGMVDEHPDIPGYRERWGHSIHHCPFCHGWEMRDRPLAALVSDEAAAHYAPLLKNWSRDVVVLTHGRTLPADARAAVEAAGIPIHGAEIVALEGRDRELEIVRLADGTTLERGGLFVKPKQHQCDLVRGLGLELDDMGFVVVDMFGATSLPHVWAAGDLATGMQQVGEAAAMGGRTGAMLVKTLVA